VCDVLVVRRLQIATQLIGRLEEFGIESEIAALTVSICLPRLCGARRPEWLPPPPLSRSRRATRIHRALDRASLPHQQRARLPPRHRSLRPFGGFPVTCRCRWTRRADRGPRETRPSCLICHWTPKSDSRRTCGIHSPKPGLPETPGLKLVERLPPRGLPQLRPGRCPGLNREDGPQPEKTCRDAASSRAEIALFAATRGPSGEVLPGRRSPFDSIHFASS
jgi:hypothetical protein